MPFLGPEGRKQMKEFGRVSTVGLELVIATCLGLYAGEWLDTQFGTAPTLQWVGLGFGLATGARSLYRVARHTKQKMKSGPLPDLPNDDDSQ